MLLVIAYSVQNCSHFLLLLLPHRTGWMLLTFLSPKCAFGCTKHFNKCYLWNGKVVRHFNQNRKILMKIQLASTQRRYHFFFLLPNGTNWNGSTEYLYDESGVYYTSHTKQLTKIKLDGLNFPRTKWRESP